jgi:AraC-like DNA-binding protein
MDVLRAMIAARTQGEGCTPSPFPGLRYYRFSGPTRYDKTQLLVPGIVIVVQGRKSARLGALTLSYDRANYLVLRRAAACHGTVVEASVEHPYLALHMDLSPALVVKTLLAMADNDWGDTREARVDNHVAPIDDAIVKAFGRLLPATDTAIDRSTLAPLIAEEIIVRLLRSGAAPAIRDAATVKRSAARIEKAMQLIQTGFRGRLSVDDLAEAVAMSPSHFAHTFREIAGVPPMHFIRTTRLDEARVLLASGKRASEVATAVGFDSAAHFSREFKRRFATTPNDYAHRLASSQP